MLPDARLRLLRMHRASSSPNNGLAATLRTQQIRLERAARMDGGVQAAWDRVVPSAIAARASVVGLKAGVLTIRCRSSSDRFTLDRWLRSGGERALRQAARLPIARVRLVLK